MKEAVYEQLADALATRGGAILPLKCPEFYSLLEELFTPEEAEVAARMPLDFVPAVGLAEQMNRNAQEVERVVEGMADKGLVICLERGGVKHYRPLPIVPGFFEFQFMKGEVNERTKRLARLFEDYFNLTQEAIKAGRAARAAAPFSRVIPVEKEIPAGIEIHPYDRVSQYIASADYISVSTCYCRHHGELLDNPCSKSKEVCMSFGPGAKFIVERGFGRRISREEAFALLERAEQEGLVHCSSNTGKYIDFICNCCSCHCGILQSILNSDVPSMAATSGFIMVVDAENCIGCEACITRCQLQAIRMEEDIAVRDADRCVGCGICISSCPTQALRLEPREHRPVPPRDHRELTLTLMASLQQRQEAQEQR
jgi:ferredoxin